MNIFEEILATRRDHFEGQRTPATTLRISYTRGFELAEFLRNINPDPRLAKAVADQDIELLREVLSPNARVAGLVVELVPDADFPAGLEVV